MVMPTYPQPAFNSAVEYTVPGVPWVTSSVLSGDLKIDFPAVTRSIFISNVSGGDLKIAFSQLGLTTNYFTVKAGSTFQENLRVKSLFLNGSATTLSVCVGLTAIPASAAPVLSGSLGYSGIG